jgi:hypothetical protein
MPRVIKSPLKNFPGDFSLPEPDEFNRLHWDTWKEGVNRPLRSSYAVYTHLHGYAGLELVKKHGSWNIREVTGEDGESAELPLGVVQSWEFDPAAEKTRFIAFIGREVTRYIENIIDPKD